MADAFPPAPIIETFARYGFRKTSMDELARAAEVSRQSLYNHFGSKEELFDWATHNVLETSLADALRHLVNPRQTLVQRINAALDSWAGQHIEVMRASPHGPEIIVMARSALPERARQAERKLITAMADAIRVSGPGATVPRAGSLAQALCWTAKGLVHAAPDHAAFRRELDHILSALLAR